MMLVHISKLPLTLAVFTKIADFFIFFKKSLFTILIVLGFWSHRTITISASSANCSFSTRFTSTPNDLVNSASISAWFGRALDERYWIDGGCCLLVKASRRLRASWEIRPKPRKEMVREGWEMERPHMTKGAQGSLAHCEGQVSVDEQYATVWSARQKANTHTARLHQRDALLHSPHGH